jgi:DMSO/TMAO reductase YedYZ molybdopterin-dependent catalytic subunit
MGTSMLRRLVAIPVVLGLSWAAVGHPTPAQAQTQSGNTALVIKGAVKQELQLTVDSLKSLPRVKLSAKGHDGAMHNYEGVTLQSLLVKAGVPTGGDLKGKSMALFVVAEAADGYRAVFSLAELDDDFAAESVLVADTADGKAIGADQGPLRLVVPGDKRQGRWVRVLKSIVVASAP